MFVWTRGGKCLSVCKRCLFLLEISVRWHWVWKVILSTIRCNLSVSVSVITLNAQRFFSNIVTLHRKNIAQRRETLLSVNLAHLKTLHLKNIAHLKRVHPKTSHLKNIAHLERFSVKTSHISTLHLKNIVHREHFIFETSHILKTSQLRSGLFNVHELREKQQRKQNNQEASHSGWVMILANSWPDLVHFTVKCGMRVTNLSLKTSCLLSASS